MSLTPRSIRTRFGLNRAFYARTAHFGRPPQADGGFSWERIALANELMRML
jgi:S-adenosylmethionine synthetase